MEVLPGSGKRGAEVLLQLQITTRSPLGALAFETGGLLVDHGWLRLLGSGGGRLQGDLARWNGLGPTPLVAPFEGAMIVGHDAVGGFFALDGGALGDGKGSAWYLTPEVLEWQPLGFGYSGLLQFALSGDLAKFYADVRWPGWEQEVAALPPDRGYSFTPPLFTEAESLASRSRQDVPMVELLGQHLELMNQLAEDDAPPPTA